VVFDQLLQSWLDSHGSVNTRSAYGSDLALFGRWCAGQNAIPLRVTAEDVAAYQAACDASGDSPSTIRRRSSSLSSFFQFAVAHDAVVDNPVAGSERPQVASGDPSPTPTLDAEVMRQYLHDASQLDCRLHALVALLALDGVKLSEALSLDVTDIAASSRRVSAHVIRSGARVPLVLHPEAGGAVRRCASGRTAGPLLVSEQRSAAGGEPRRLTRFGADHLIKRLAPHSGHTTHRERAASLLRLVDPRRGSRHRSHPRARRTQRRAQRAALSPDQHPPCHRPRLRSAAQHKGGLSHVHVAPLRPLP
jgi:site-specific recombinase XerD